MAFYYSRRKLKPREEEEAGELNIVPYLDILMNLILFMLLSITGLASFGILNVSAPSYGGPSAGVQQENPDQPKLTLSVSNAVEVLVSAVSMCRKNVSVAAVAADGMVTVCSTVSVCVVP